MHGLKRGKVKLQKDHDKWSDIFKEEKIRLKNTLGNLEIYHIGSTAIPGLTAKPIIDILVGVYKEHDLDALIPKLESLDYQYKGEEGVKGRYFFVKGPENKRLFYLHAFPVDDVEYQRILKFRDKLRSDASLRDEYESLKIKLANLYPDERKKYTSGKNEFIKKVVK